MLDSRIRPVGGPHPVDGRPEHFRRVVSFHPRGGRLNDVQRRAFETVGAAWYLDPDTVAAPLSSTGLFGRDAPLVLEIGSGMGESTAAMAAARPEVNLVAVEVYKPGVAQTFHHLARLGVETVRVLRADGLDVLSTLVAPGSLAEIWLFFPDPWPKTKHRKRRLVNPEFIALAARALAPGGVARMATDWEPYAEQMVAVAEGCAQLRNAAAGYAPRPAFRPPTRFERRGLAAQRRIFDLAFVRA